MTRHISVDADWIPLDHPHSVGRLAIDRVRGKESISFEYDSQWIVQNQLDVDADLQQLWRRIVFSIAIQNTDDHLRNHGFLLTESGWRLSPAYDVNPDPQAVGLALNINEFDNSLDFVLALEVAPLFRLDESSAQTILEQVSTSVGNWRSVARELDISRAEQERMRLAFEH